MWETVHGCVQVVPIRPDLSLSQMNVTVTNPMLVGSGISKYTTYLVTTQVQLLSAVHSCLVTCIQPESSCVPGCADGAAQLS